MYKILLAAAAVLMLPLFAQADAPANPLADAMHSAKEGKNAKDAHAADKKDAAEPAAGAPAAEPAAASPLKTSALMLAAAEEHKHEHKHMHKHEHKHHDKDGAEVKEEFPDDKQQ